MFKVKINKGTTFILNIPLSESYLSDKQKIKEETKNDNFQDTKSEALTDKNYFTEENNTHSSNIKTF